MHLNFSHPIPPLLISLSCKLSCMHIDVHLFLPCHCIHTISLLVFVQGSVNAASLPTPLYTLRPHRTTFARVRCGSTHSAVVDVAGRLQVLSHPFVARRGVAATTALSAFLCRECCCASTIPAFEVVLARSRGPSSLSFHARVRLSLIAYLHGFLLIFRRS